MKSDNQNIREESRLDWVFTDVTAANLQAGSLQRIANALEDIRDYLADMARKKRAEGRARTRIDKIEEAVARLDRAEELRTKQEAEEGMRSLEEILEGENGEAVVTEADRRLKYARA